MKNVQPVPAATLSTTHENFNQSHYDKRVPGSSGWPLRHNYSVAILLSKDYSGDTVVVSPAAELVPSANFSDTDLRVCEGQWSRRDLLRYGLMTTGAALGANLMGPFSSTASANPVMWWVLRTAFAAAITWYVGRVLEEWAGDKKIVLASATPTPSRGSKPFHDSHGSPHRVKNYTIPPTRGAGGCYCALDGYLYATSKLDDLRSVYDYNPLELITIKENNVRKVWRHVPLPTQERKRADNGYDHGRVQDWVRYQYPDVDPKECTPMFKRLFRVGETEEKQAYGIRILSNPEERAFIIVEG